MRIVSGPEEWLGHVQCRGCRAELEYNAGDVAYGDFGALYADDHDWKFFVRCPNDGTRIFIEEPPPSIAQVARDRLNGRSGRQR